MLSVINRPLIPCGMCPNSSSPLRFHRVNGIQSTLDCPIIISFKLNLQSN